MPHPLSQLKDLVHRYAAAWSSHDPASVAAFSTDDGRIEVADGEPSVGREAISRIAADFFAAFPDLVISVNDVRRHENTVLFTWTLDATNSGPGGTGNRVSLGGWEVWTVTDDLKIARVRAWLDPAEFERQVQNGV